MNHRFRSRLVCLLGPIGCLLTAPEVVLAQGLVTFIPATDTWRYLDNGSDQGTAWRLKSFSDASWPSGAAVFGYGRNDVATPVGFGPDPANKYITTYFRKTFTATNVASLYNLVVRVERDDGGIVYLNGIEVFRSNMPTGAVSYVTLAAGAAVGPDESSFFETNIDPALLLEGTNVLAVEVHQVGPASPDLAFDLELLALIPGTNSLHVPPAYSAFANNYSRGGNTLNEIMPSAADGTLLLKWDAAKQNYGSNVYDAFSASWSPNATLVPGEGAFICSPVAQTLALSGQIPPAPAPVSRPAGAVLLLVSCRAPVAASSFEQLMGFEPVVGDRVLVYEGAFATLPDPKATPATHIYQFTVAGWTPAPPVLAPGQAAFVDLVAYPIDPCFFLQPQSQTVTEGEPVTFTAFGFGAAPLAYQWLRNGQILGGTTFTFLPRFGTELTLPTVGLADNGSIYSLVVSNTASQAFSSNAVLTVNRPTFAEDLLVYDSFNYPPNTQVVGRDGGAGWTGVWGGLAPMYSTCTNRTSSLAPGVFPDYPTSGGSAVIDLPANSGDHLQRSLDLLTTNHSELWFSVIISGDGQSGDDRLIMQFDSGYPLEMGAYGLGANSQAHWTIQNRPDAMGPVVKTNEPTLLVLQMVNNSLTTHQLNLYVNPSPGQVGPVPPDATWTLAGWRLDRLILLQYIVNGGLTQHALDEIRIGTSYAQINYDPHVRITTQPQSETVMAGDPVDLSVEASGAPPLLYQWFRDGQSLAGATSSFIHISQASVADAGVYSVLVANSLGSQLSSNAVLTVRPPAFPADLLVYDSFAYPSNTQVVGQTGGFGWTGPWTGQIPMFSYFTNQASSLLPPGDPDYATAGGSAAIDLPANTFNYLARTLDLETTNSSELWFGVIISPNGQAVGDRFIFRFGSTVDLEIGAYSPDANTPARWTIEQRLDAMGPIITPNVPSLLLLQMVNTSLTAHQFNLYVNPPSGSTAPSPDATWVLPNLRLDQLTQVQYVVNGGLTHHALDEIRIGTSYATVARPGVPITFHGLANSPLGQASLFGGTGGAVSGQLVVSNIGSNGLDGVSVSLDGFEFGALTLGPTVTNILPTGGELTMRVYGEVNGATNQVISTLHATSVGGGAVELRAEFNALNDVPACRSLVYDGATLVASASGVTGAVARVLSPTAGDRWLPYLPANGLLWAEVDFPSRPTIQLGGDGAPVQGTRLLIAPDVARLTYPDIKFDPAQISTDTGLQLWYKDPGTLGNWGQPGDPPPSHVIIGAISHIDVLAKNVPQLTILGEEAGMFGFAHRTIGPARLTVQRRGDLLGSPELDLDADPAGPSATLEWSAIAIPIADTAIPIADTATPIPDQSVRWLDPDPSNSLPMGAFLQAKIISPAPLNTTNSPQILGSIQATKTASNTVALTADFSAAGATNTIVEIWNQGVITTNIVGPVPMTVTVDQMPSYFAAPGVPYGSDPQVSHPFPQDLSFGWASSVLISIKGTNALGDQIRFRAPGAPYTNVAFGSFGLSIGGGLNHLGIIDEQASPPGEYFDGLAFLPIGQATLTTVSNELVVSNLTANADFGASVALGDSSGAALSVVALDGINPNGDLRVRTFGMLDGVPDQLIGAIIASKLGTNIQFSTDLSPIADPANPFYFNVAVYDGPNLVGVSGFVTNPVVTIESLAPAPAGPYVCGPWHLSRPGSFATHIDLPERVPITIAGHPPVLGTRIVFDACINCGDPGIPTTDIGAISRVEVVASGLSSFRITQAQLDMYQQLHSALGSAHLFAVGSELHVNNLVSGPDSPDGVEFPTVDGDKNGFAAYWRQITPFPYNMNTPPPWGPALRVTALGALSPIPAQDQILASSQVTRVGNTNEISADFSPLALVGPQRMKIEVLNGSSLMSSTVLNASTGVVARINEFAGVWSEGALIGPMYSNSPSITWFASAPAQIQVNGQVVAGDHIRISAQADPSASITLASVRLQAFGIPKLVFLNDALVPPANLPTNCIDFHCPTNLTAYACGSNCVSVPFTVTATDRCTSNSVYVVTDLPSDYCFQLGTTWVYALAYANGQIGQSSFPVTVLADPNCMPTNVCIDISCPSNVIAYTCGTNCVRVPFHVSATNRCNAQDLEVVTDPVRDYCFPLGTTWVQVTAYGSGQSNQCSFPVIVLADTNCGTPPVLVAGTVVRPVGTTTFTHDLNGNLVIGNPGGLGSANGLSLKVPGANPADRNHVEFQFDRAIPGTETLAGAMFRYQLDGDNGPLDWIEGRSLDAGGPYFVTVRDAPVTFATRSLKLYLQGALIYQESSRNLAGNSTLSLAAQPNQVGARLLADGSILWTISWSDPYPSEHPYPQDIRGLLNSPNPVSCDRLEIASSPNLLPIGTQLQAAQFLSSGVPSRTLITPPPSLTGSLVGAGGQLGLQLTVPTTYRDFMVQETILSSPWGSAIWKPLWGMVGNLGVGRTLHLDVSVAPVRFVRIWELPVPPPDSCPLPSEPLMNYFLTKPTAWRLVDLWDALGSASSQATVQAALSGELDRLVLSGSGPSSSPWQFTRSLADQASIPLDAGALPDDSGAAGCPYSQYHVLAGSADAAADGTVAHPFGTLRAAFDKANADRVCGVELLLSGAFGREPAVPITRHTQIKSECGLPTCASIQYNFVLNGAYRLELQNLNTDTAGDISIQAYNRSAYVALNNVAVRSVHITGASLVMQNCTVSSGPFDQPPIWLDGGAQAVLQNCDIFNNQYAAVHVFGTSLAPTHVRLVRTRIRDNDTVQLTFDRLAGEPLAGAVNASGYASIEMDWCVVQGNHGPAVVAIGPNAHICMFFSSVSNVLPVRSATPQFSIGLGAYHGGLVQASFCDLTGAVSSDPAFSSNYAIQLATGGRARLAASRVRNFLVPANVQTTPFDPAVLNQYCDYVGTPLTPVNTDPVLTPAP